MSVTTKAFKGGLWFALFSAVSQTISWIVTVLVARVLSPGDYALMDMATILTGYVHIFEELGIGAAVIQREKVTENELSSLFWCLVLWGVILALVCLGLSYPTVAIYGEPRIYRLTQAVAALFVIGPIIIVPRHLLQRELRFKAIGFVQSTAVVISCLAMLIMAHRGAGVWTLLGGHIIRQFSQMVLVFFAARWRPRLYFNFREALPYIRFGIPVAGSASLNYVYSRADIFFGGQRFNPEVLGYYSISQRLTEIPNSKILSIVNSVSYPVFARYQSDRVEFKNFFLKLFKVVSLLVIPLYSCGIVLAHELIVVVLGEKWTATVLPFQLLCVSHLAASLTASSSLAANALGKPKWNFFFNAAAVPIMVGGFYLAARFGATTQQVAYLTIPWAVCFSLMRVVFLIKILPTIGIKLVEVGRAILSPFAATTILACLLLAFRYWYFSAFEPTSSLTVCYLGIAMSFSALYYAAFVILYEGAIVRSMWRMINSNTD